MHGFGFTRAAEVSAGQRIARGLQLMRNGILPKRFSSPIRRRTTRGTTTRKTTIKKKATTTTTTTTTTTRRRRRQSMPSSSSRVRVRARRRCHGPLTGLREHLQHLAVPPRRYPDCARRGARPPMNPTTNLAPHGRPAAPQLPKLGRVCNWAFSAACPFGRLLRPRDALQASSHRLSPRYPDFTFIFP